MFLAFGGFIICCGGTHFMEVWTLWSGLYWLSGAVKLFTAVASVATAVMLPPLVPKTLSMVRAAKLSEDRQEELERANVALVREVAERRRAEDEVRQLAAALDARVQERTAELARANEELAEKAALVEHSQDAILSWTLEGTITSWNPAAERVYGYTSAEMIGHNVTVLVPPERKQELAQLLDWLKAGDEPKPFETTKVRKDGTLISTAVAISPLKDAEGRVRGACVITRDITERNRSEEQLRQVQKLESLGLIAGGVAHDFNNLLVGILGNASLALESLHPADPNRTLLDQVVKASEKAAHLTEQMLAYAGKGQIVSSRVDLSGLVLEMAGLIETSIPKTVHLRLELDPELPTVIGDPGQLQQVVMSLVINGAEAMGDRVGEVRVATAVEDVDETYIRHGFAGESLSPGIHVRLEVQDSGCGMDEALRTRIFDPFFTTKFAGRGLGLSAVAGIVRSHKGVISVESEPGVGSTFRILLPAVEEPRPAAGR